MTGTDPITNLKEMLDSSTRKFGDKNAFLVKSGDGSYAGITYTEFRNDVNSLGTAFLYMGLKDRHIAIIGENRYEWCVTYLAAACGTGVAIPLDKELPVQELLNLLVRSNANAIVFSGKLSDDIMQIQSELSSVKYFINMDAMEDSNRFLSFSSLLKKGRQLISLNDRSFIDSTIDNEKLSVLIFTSGTTDLAKGVMLSHKNICSDVISVSSAIQMGSSDSILSILPLHHTYECTAGFLTMIYNGCCISFCEGLKHIAKNLKEVKPTLLISVPLILESMYKKIWDQAAKEKGLKFKLKAGLFISDILYNFCKINVRKKLFSKIHNTLGDKLRLVISGAAAINPEVLKGFNSMGITVVQGYGLTECSPIVTVNRLDCIRHDSIGFPLPGVEIKISEPNEEGIGELMVKSDIVMIGYYENEPATSKVLKDGWLYTGDLGYADRNGYYYITGRKKNVIVTKNGKNIFPEEVEAYLNKSPLILESLVWGIEDKQSGEVYVNAQIVPDFDAIKQKLESDDVSKEDVYGLIAAEVKSANKSMPLYKHIRKFTIRENEFIKTTTRKIKRYAEKIS